MPTNRNIIKRIVFFFVFFSLYRPTYGEWGSDTTRTTIPPVSVGSISLCSTLWKTIIQLNWQTSPGIVGTRNFFFRYSIFVPVDTQTSDRLHTLQNIENILLYYIQLSTQVSLNACGRRICVCLLVRVESKLLCLYMK